MIEKKTKNLLLIFLIIFLIILSLFSIIKKTGTLRNIAQELRIISCQPYLGKNAYTEQIKNISLGFLNYLKKGCDYNYLKIKIKHEDFEIIKKIREKAILENILINSKYIPAEIIWQNKTYSAKLKLKGDLKTHWIHPKQWSFKITLKKGKSIMGLKEFSITRFEERQFPGNQKLAKKLAEDGIITPNFFPVKVNVNNINWGPMLIEEQYSDAYLELRGLKDSPIARFADSSKNTIARYLKEYFKKNNLKSMSSNYLTKSRKFRINIYNSEVYKKKSSNINLISILKTINEITQIENYSIEDIEHHIDIQKFAKVLAVSLVYGDFHSMKEENMKYYINPYNIKIEPIPTDHIVNHQLFQNNNEMNNNIKNYMSNFYFSLFKIKSFQENFFIELEKVGQDINNSTILNNLCDKYINACLENISPLIAHANFNLLKTLDFTIFENKNTNFVNIDEEREILRKVYKNLYFKPNDLYGRIYTDGEIHLYNLSPFEIDIKEIELKESFYSSGGDKKCKNIKINISKIISSYNGFDILKKINLNQEICLYQNIEIIYLRKDGIKKVLKIYVEDNAYKPSNFVKNKKFASLPNFIKKNKDTYIIPSGNWIIKEPLVISDNHSLIVEAGAIISFVEDSYIFIEKGNLIISGEKDNKVHLLPFEKSWGGIYVLNANKKSLISNAVIKGLDEFEHGSIKLTGSINFYNSSIDILNTEFSNSFSEDAINIVKSQFKINNTKFLNIKSDAIDSDFSNGLINNTLFYSIGGDGVDLSGSNINLRGSKFKNIADKSISVGENSKITINDIEIFNSGFGVVAKDGSIVDGFNIFISDSKIADVAAYRKKSFYNEAQININNLNHNNKIIIQEGSMGIINNKIIKTEKFNSEIFYN